MGGGIFPVPNSTQSYWRTELHEIDSHRSTPELPPECDIVVIGAGLAGVGTAYHLLDENPTPPSIVMLEAREVCSGATGRNGGHLALLHSNIAKNVASYGIDAAEEMARFQAEHVYALKHVVEKENLKCDFILTRLMEVLLNQDEANRQKAEWNEILRLGVKGVEDVDYIGPEYAEILTGVKGAKAAFSATAAQLWPYKFVSSLLATLLQRGHINLQTQTPVTSVTTSPSGSNTVHTCRGSIKARTIVFATNAYTAGILPQYMHTIVPTKATCSHSVVSKGKHESPAPPHLSHTYGISYPDPQSRGRDYVIPRPDGGVVIGGAKSVWFADRREWYDVVDDSTGFEGGKEYFAGVMGRNFLGWEGSAVETDYVWTGIIGRTPDELPHVGAVPGKVNQYILAGFNGAGMPHVFLSSRGVARMIREGVGFQESGVPRAFQTTKERLESTKMVP